MTEQTPAGTRGAVDLTAITGAGAGPGASASASQPTARHVPAELVVPVTADTLQSALGRTLSVAGVLVVWSSAHPQTAALVEEMGQLASELEGRILVLTADVSADPTLMQILQPVLVQAFGQLAVPATFGVLQGQPIPLFPGLPAPDQIRAAIDQLLAAAVQSGIAGRVDFTPAEGGEEAALPPLHQEAYDAIERGDLAAAAAAYEKALADNPKDTDAELGQAQVRLMQRTDGVDLAQARAAAAADPSDVAAACTVADLDLLGGHVEDAFARLLDLVRSAVGEDRDRARTHLIELFAVVGNADERVKRGRTALMSALF